MISKKRLKEIKEIFILIIIAFTIKTCLIEIYVVPTGSMEKTILIGDNFFFAKFIKDFKLLPFPEINTAAFNLLLPINFAINFNFFFPRNNFSNYIRLIFFGKKLFDFI